MDSLNSEESVEASSEGAKRYGKVAAWTAGGLTALLLFTVSALGHDWYPAYCCGGHDCKQLGRNEVKVTPLGYEILGRFHKNFDEAAPSPDEFYHACVTGGNEVSPEPKLQCFFAPRGAS